MIFGCQVCVSNIAILNTLTGCLVGGKELARWEKNNAGIKCEFKF